MCIRTAFLFVLLLLYSLLPHLISNYRMNIKVPQIAKSINNSLIQITEGPSYPFTRNSFDKYCELTLFVGTLVHIQSSCVLTKCNLVIFFFPINTKNCAKVCVACNHIIKSDSDVDNYHQCLFNMTLLLCKAFLKP